jgi:hypothetical protein
MEDYPLLPEIKLKQANIQETNIQVVHILNAASKSFVKHFHRNIHCSTISQFCSIWKIHIVPVSQN